MIEELSDIIFPEAIIQLFELFKEVFANEMMLSEETLNNIIDQFIQKTASINTKSVKNGCLKLNLAVDYLVS